MRSLEHRLRERWREKQLSLCPQDNPMYESITVDEHLHFFAELRGSQKQGHEVTQVRAETSQEIHRAMEKVKAEMDVKSIKAEIKIKLSV